MRSYSMPAPAGFQNGLDAVHAALFELAHLLARFVRRLGRCAPSARLQRFRIASGTYRVIFRAVPALGREHGAADEKLRAQLAAAGDLAAQFERRVQTVARAARRGDAAIEQRRGAARGMVLSRS